MWSPALPDTAEPIWRRMVDTLQSDIQTGLLRAGDRLPPQRDLAHRLGLGVGTVTRAYSEAMRRGLLVGEVGRGSFVAQPAMAPIAAGPIDLARNLPPLGSAAQALAAGVAQLSRRRDLADQVDYPAAGGPEAARRALALWLQRTANWRGLNWRRLMVTAGAQQGVAVALAATCQPGDAVIAEEATFHGIKGLAAQMAYRLVPAAMDAEGLTPQALERAAAGSGARVAYVLPVQNPTARVMGAARREALLDVARRRGLTLIEDDIYGPFAASLGHAPLAATAPDLVWHVTSLSKSLAPGLRVGCVIPPSEEGFERALEATRAFAFGAPTLGPMLAAEWIEGGEAFEILGKVKSELSARTTLARRILGTSMEATPMSAAPHIWLPMNELEAERVAGRALRAGVQTTAPRAMFLDGVAVTGLRLCLGPPRDLDALEGALEVVRASLSAGRADAMQVV